MRELQTHWSYKADFDSASMLFEGREYEFFDENSNFLESGKFVGCGPIEKKPIFEFRRELKEIPVHCKIDNYTRKIVEWKKRVYFSQDEARYLLIRNNPEFSEEDKAFLNEYFSPNPDLPK
jgi:hypothetical protein